MIIHSDFTAEYIGTLTYPTPDNDVELLTDDGAKIAYCPCDLPVTKDWLREHSGRRVRIKARVEYEVEIC